MDLSLAEVKELFIQLWPPGRLYDWYNPRSFISRFFDGVAETLKTFGFDLVERLRREVNPASATELLRVWESALDLSETETAQRGTLSQRRATVLARLRERDAFTHLLVRTVFAPLLGIADSSALRVLETDRTAMRAAHTYSHGHADSGGLPVIALALYVPDGGVVSDAGPQIVVDADGFDGPDLLVSLTAPDGRRAEWRITAPPPLSRVFYAPEFAGARCDGLWHLTIINEPNTGSLVIRGWSLFVEGVGPHGLARDVFDWGVYVDPNNAGATGPLDLRSARAALTRIQHAHTSGTLVFSLAAVPDEPPSLPDQCLPV
jgi:hypothetical protein